MSYKEYMEWVEYSKYEPLHTEEVQLAVISSLMTAFGGKAINASEFMVSRDSLENKQKQISGAELDKLIQGMF